MGTAIVLVLLVIAVIFALRKIYHDRKEGKSLSCSGDCRNCMSSCKNDGGQK